MFKSHLLTLPLLICAAGWTACSQDPPQADLPKRAQEEVVDPVVPELHAALQGEAELVKTRSYTFQNPEGPDTEPRTMVLVPEEPRTPPKTSPRHGYKFPFLVSGFGKSGPDAKGMDLRFRVYYQEQKAEDNPAPFVARTLLRFWDYNVQHLQLDHNPIYNGRIVDVYLCEEGQPGAEQRFDEDRDDGQVKKVNTIYVYDISSFNNPVQMLREIAHEYGHATLPPIGGFETPEDWANGYLGERLFMRHLRDELAAGRMEKEDMLMATLPGLNKWVAENVEPLVLGAATNAPDLKLLAGKGQKAMDAYMGLALYAESILPKNAFARSIKLTGSTNAKDYPAAIVLAAEEPDQLRLNIPKALIGKQIWIPLGKGKLNGPKAIKQQAGWALVEARGPALTIKNR